MILKLSETSSTNTFVQQMLLHEKVENGTIVWAEKQTAGRGQVGNSWESEPLKNITCSAVFYPEIDVKNQFFISEAVALAVIDFFDEMGINCEIKWPNDIYFGEKKIAGILIEQNLYGKEIESCVVGIGINVNQTKFCSDAPNPISLKQITLVDYDVEQLILLLQKKLKIRFERLKTENFHQEYMTKLFRRNGYYSFEDSEGAFVARISDIECDGHLILENTEKQHIRYAFKEVKFLI